MWTFALTVDGAFVPIPIARLRRFLDGEDTLPSVDDVVYVADVHVELEAREATRATIYGFFKYKVGRNGRWDPGHKHDADAAWTDLMDSIWSQPRADGVVGGDRFAKRRMDVHHRWKPTRSARPGQRCHHQAREAGHRGRVVSERSQPGAQLTQW